MLRSILAGLILAALIGPVLWGGCAPCVQLFSHASSGNGCCLPSGKCKTPSEPAGQKHCLSPAQELQQYVKADLDDVGPVGVPAKAGIVSLISLQTRLFVPQKLILPSDSPPDLFRLNSAFLI